MSPDAAAPASPEINGKGVQKKFSFKEKEMCPAQLGSAHFIIERGSNNAKVALSPARKVITPSFFHSKKIFFLDFS